MIIKYINSVGGGFNSKIEIDENTTIEQFVGAKMPGETRTNLNIRINAAVALPGQILRPGDVVSIIPGKYEGGTNGLGGFLGHLKDAAAIGKQFRDDKELLENITALGSVAKIFTPELASNLAAVSELGKTLRADPELVANVKAAVGLIDAIRSLGGAAETANAAVESIGNYRPSNPNINIPATAAAVPADAAPVPIITLVPKANVEGNKIALILGRGLGSAVDIDPGKTTLLDLFNQVKQGKDPVEYRITVNGLTSEADYLLQPGDSVEIRDVATLNRR